MCVERFVNKIVWAAGIAFEPMPVELAISLFLLAVYVVTCGGIYCLKEKNCSITVVQLHHGPTGFRASTNRIYVRHCVHDS